MAKHKYTIDELVTAIKNEYDNETIEGQLLMPKFIRELYKQLGAPTEKEFPDECKTAGSYWSKMSGYTTYIQTRTPEEMKSMNDEPTDWRIKRPSMIKVEIVEKYTRGGWHCRVQAHNVLCERYVKHPKHKGLWVMFYSSRDCNKYEYVIEV